jgi:hypothetical protein
MQFSDSKAERNWIASLVFMPGHLGHHISSEIQFEIIRGGRKNEYVGT